MKLAATYENGQIFQHFGRTETFKIYEIEDNLIISEEIIGTGGTGHEALAGFLADRDVEVVLCGGLGGGAQSALDEAGIAVISGAAGDADEAVQAYLRGELESTGVNCDHHHEEPEGAEGAGCGGCGGGCGGCGGCGGEPVIILEGKNAGKTCKVHYKGTFNDGTQFDSSYDRGEPLEFICGAGMMIRGFDAAVVEMEPGQTVEIHLAPEEAYGEYDPAKVISIEIAQIPGAEDVEAGQQVFLTNPMGQRFPVTVTEKDETMITFDANHELAGKELNFVIELVEVQ